MKYAIYCFRAFLLFLAFLAMIEAVAPEIFPPEVQSLAVFIGALGWPFIMVGGRALCKYEDQKALLAKRARQYAEKGLCCIGEEGPCPRRSLQECENHFRHQFGLEPQGVSK